MNLLKIHPSDNFLEILAEFIIKKFSQDRISNVKIILPTGILCYNLQKILTIKQNIAILPQIMSFNNMKLNISNIFDIEFSSLNPINAIHEQIILTDIIINSNDKMTFEGAMEIASLISKIFYLSIRAGVKIEVFSNDFLQIIYDKYIQKLHEVSKCTKADYEMMIMQNYYQLENIIIAGIFGDDDASWSFLANIMKSENNFLILSIGDEIFSNENIIDENDSNYALKYLLKYLEKNINDFTYINTNYLQYNSINYTEYDNIYSEIQDISKICLENSNKKIAITINDEDFKNHCIIGLLKNNLSYSLLSGMTHDTSAVSIFIINIAKVIYDYDILKFIELLKHPFMNGNKTHELCVLLSKSNYFIQNNEQILDLLTQSENCELLNWFVEINNILKIEKSNNLHSMICHIISIAEKLCNNLWQNNNYADELSEFLNKIIDLKLEINLNNIKEFPIILKKILSNAKYFNVNDDNIVIGTSKDLYLLKFDIILIPNCNIETYPKLLPRNPFLKKEIIVQLNLHHENIEYNMQLYYFTFLINNNCTKITRSLESLSFSNFAKSHYISKLELLNLLPKISNNFKTEKVYNSFLKNKADYLVTEYFPDKISASDIELLMRCPYAFYAKKILNLRKIFDIGAEPSTSDFGQFIHKIFEIYSKNYHKYNDIITQIKFMTNISDKLLEDSIYPIYNKKLLKIQIDNILPKFIEFDESQRANSSIIYSELKGQIKLNGLMINAIADRIEIDIYGNATIIDYKTGTLPTNKDIENLISPQLIILAMILHNGGFNIKINKISKLIYVKISNSYPYITSKIINLEHSLEYYFDKLEQIINDYMINKKFKIDYDHSNYNDYKYLMR
jgi:ATP-dependent helicase/nuclease subunit B